MVATSLRIHFTIGGNVANLTFWCMIGEFGNFEHYLLNMSVVLD